MDLSDNDPDVSPRHRRMDLSKPKDEKRNGSMWSTEVPLSDNDIAFVLGKRGSTKSKIARVSRTRLNLDEERKCLEITASTEAARKRGEKYVNLVLQQRTCRPEVDPEDEALNEMVIIPVPQDCVGRITGNKGSALREMEDRWDVLILWVSLTKQTASASLDQEHTLAVFGRLQPRTAAELRLISRLAKMDDNYLAGKGEIDKLLNRVHERELGVEERPESHSGPWGVDTSIFDSEEDLRYASGAGGRTREKIANAAGCVIGKCWDCSWLASLDTECVVVFVEFIRDVVVFAGFASDRARGQEYMRWLVEQRVGDSVVENEEKRKDCAIIDVDSKNVGFITGARGAALQRVETETKTFIFSRRKEVGKIARFLVFSYNKDRRKKAIDILKRRVHEKKELDEAKSEYYYSPERTSSGNPKRQARDRGHDRDRERSNNRPRNKRYMSESPQRHGSRGATRSNGRRYSGGKGRRGGREWSRKDMFDERGSRQPRSRSPRQRRR